MICVVEDVLFGDGGECFHDVLLFGVFVDRWICYRAIIIAYSIGYVKRFFKKSLKNFFEAIICDHFATFVVYTHL